MRRPLPSICPQCETVEDDRATQHRLVEFCNECRKKNIRRIEELISRLFDVALKEEME